MKAERLFLRIQPSTAHGIRLVVEVVIGIMNTLHIHTDLSINKLLHTDSHLHLVSIRYTNILLGRNRMGKIEQIAAVRVFIRKSGKK